MQDARISTSLPGHPKTKKLAKRLGPAACWHLVCLFLWTAANRSDGSLTGMTNEDIELAVDWAGDDGAFVSALKSVGFLDGTERDYAVHDWADHNPWAAGAETRSAKARWNAIKRHHGEAEANRLVPEWAAIRDADSNSLDAASNATAGAANDAANDAASTHASILESNAPSPSPSPSPSAEEAVCTDAPESDGELMTTDSDGEQIANGSDTPPAEKKSSPSEAAPSSLLGVRELVAEGVNRQHAEDWLRVRKAKRMPLTRSAWDSTVAEAKKFGITPAEAVRMAAERGWGGFLAIYAKNAGASTGQRSATDSYFEGVNEKFKNYNGPTVTLL